ncbi:hypothetical protein DOY81_013577 [Sarcophaga bullata]|nr:hypothetical protein DOY81_013577 [Sarcophaga bullata]
MYNGQLIPNINNLCSENEKYEYDKPVRATDAAVDDSGTYDNCWSCTGRCIQNCKI